MAIQFDLNDCESVMNCLGQYASDVRALCDGIRELVHDCLPVIGDDLKILSDMTSLRKCHIDILCSLERLDEIRKQMQRELWNSYSALEKLE